MKRKSFQRKVFVQVCVLVNKLTRVNLKSFPRLVEVTVTGSLIIIFLMISNAAPPDARPEPGVSGHSNECSHALVLFSDESAALNNVRPGVFGCESDAI